MPCKKTTDEYGTLYRVPAYDPKVPKAFHGGKHLKSLEPRPCIDVWWDRDAKDKANEDICIRQENAGERADVIIVNLGQAYDLIHALGCLIMDK